MNTWSAYTAGSVAMVVLHSVPPLVVFVAAEAITDVRERLTEAATVAFMTAANSTRMAGTGMTPGPTRPVTVHGTAGVRRRSRSRGARQPRKLFADYLAEARAAWSPGVAVTPAWVREVAGCSRGLSPRVAAALRAELADVSDGPAPNGEVRP